MKYTTFQIKKIFLNFFKQHNHKILPGISLIPPEESNLLFTNAGMNQFQNIFLGKKKPLYPQAVTVQKCLRTGGKHNDFNQVGCSQYHNTFFEMLGNFSFGSYFKKEAISYAWELLTNKKLFNIPIQKLFVTVYEEDNESYNIWKNIIQLPLEDIIIVGNQNNKKYESDNFWQMGQTGPCGPCTEIFFKKRNKKFELKDLNDKTQCIEIWNIVFIQYNKIDQNTIIPLKILSVDTGMGVERIASVLQNVHSNYEIDVFRKIIDTICSINQLKIKKHPSLNIISDHIRAIIFIILDNISPSNEHRGYVLRRIIRRVLVHGEKLGIKKMFLYKLIPDVIKVVCITNKNIQKYIENTIYKEELQFFTTFKNGLKILHKYIYELKQKKQTKLNSNLIVYLYDTLGFPINLTQDICFENNIIYDNTEIQNILLQQKQINQKNTKKNLPINIIQTNCQSTFVGYQNNSITSIVRKIFVNNQNVTEILPKELGIIILDKTPFFGESGGQIGDKGTIYTKNARFIVTNTQNFVNSIGHIGYLECGIIKLKDDVISCINHEHRILIQNNHSATHLLYTSLKKILNKNIEQKGSFINDKYLRFDFSYFNIISITDIKNIENNINQNIQNNIVINNDNLDFQIAKSKKYHFLKHKKYNNIVRTISIGNISKEICKGTHAKRTGDIGIFKIISCKSIAFGIKRIEALTGVYARQNIYHQHEKLENIKNILNTNNISIIPKIQKLIKTNNFLKTENDELHQKLMLEQKAKIIQNLKKIKNINFIFQEVQIKQTKLLKMMMDQIKSKINTGIIILFYQCKNKYIFIAGVTKNLIHIIQADKIISMIIQKTKGSGGGKAELSECIAKNFTNINNIINELTKWISSKIA